MKGNCSEVVRKEDVWLFWLVLSKVFEVLVVLLEGFRWVFREGNFCFFDESALEGRQRKS
jgi:hypothetical protein